ncbi:hypothetical protein G7Y89_g6955 [Cudoniella acicularis]|uniref:histidinol-phosphatase n=1 Tax=Cudoniella acicularis TaxID=354080 RepID=A0A8H4W2J1_9HELO|nr:hypothetical protein G7Y89_g6955 [Cudoniella acicularis]
MAFSMHSHSGEFCPGHAKDNLEDVILTAIARGFQTFALTEHMPRTSDSDLYPEEISAGHTISLLQPRHDAFIEKALSLRAKYSSQIHLLIGFEAEWIRPSYSTLISTLSSSPSVDFFIGSVHHVHEIPIDYDKAIYAKAVAASSGSEEKLFEDYFDSQFEMLNATKPKVVGHFDLIRLLAEEPDKDLSSFPAIWKKVVRNLKIVVELGALLEVNSSALRKGLSEPYPRAEICREYLKAGGKLALSDDSHGIEQVGTNYTRVLEFLDGLGVEDVWTLESVDGKVKEKVVKILDVKASFKAQNLPHERHFKNAAAVDQYRQVKSLAIRFSFRNSSIFLHVVDVKSGLVVVKERITAFNRTGHDGISNGQFQWEPISALPSWVFMSLVNELVDTVDYGYRVVIGDSNYSGD